MKQLIFIMALLFCSLLEAQVQKIHFEYDSAGNQIVREYCSTCSLRQSNEDYKDLTEVTDEDLKKFFPEDVISYYPNPVQDELFIKWELIDNNKVQNIEIISMNGQVMKNINQTLNTDSQIISFLQYPIGIYFVNLNYTNGEQKSIKIIKQ